MYNCTCGTYCFLDAKNSQFCSAKLTANRCVLTNWNLLIYVIHSIVSHWSCITSDCTCTVSIEKKEKNCVLIADKDSYGRQKKRKNVLRFILKFPRLLTAGLKSPSRKWSQKADKSMSNWGSYVKGLGYTLETMVWKRGASCISNISLKTAWWIFKQLGTSDHHNKMTVCTQNSGQHLSSQSKGKGYKQYIIFDVWTIS